MPWHKLKFGNVNGTEHYDRVIFLRPQKQTGSNVTAEVVDAGRANSAQLYGQRLGMDAHDIRHGDPRKGMVNKLKIEGFLYNWRPSNGQVTGKQRTSDDID